MATLHFVKLGQKPNGERVTVSHEIGVEALAQAFPTVDAAWTVSSPTFNEARRTNDFEHYRFVVLEVEPNETHGLFDKPGFYTLAITPKEASEKLGLSGPGA